MIQGRRADPLVILELWGSGGRISALRPPLECPQRGWGPSAPEKRAICFHGTVMVVVLGEQKFCDSKAKSCSLCSEVSGGDTLGWPHCAGTCSSQTSPDRVSQETAGKYFNFSGGRAAIKRLLPAELFSPCPAGGCTQEPQDGRDPGGGKNPLSFPLCPEGAKACPGEGQDRGEGTDSAAGPSNRAIPSVRLPWCKESSLSSVPAQLPLEHPWAKGMVSLPGCPREGCGNWERTGSLGEQPGCEEGSGQEGMGWFGSSGGSRSCVIPAQEGLWNMGHELLKGCVGAGGDSPRCTQGLCVHSPHNSCRQYGWLQSWC